MTTSKKNSTAKPKNRTPNLTPNPNQNRYETFADDSDEPKPSYSKVASSNRVTDMPLSTSKTEPTHGETMVIQESKLDTLLNAIQNIDERMNDTDTKIQNQFWTMNSRFSALENTLEKSTNHDSDIDDTQLSRPDQDIQTESNRTDDMSSDAQDNVRSSDAQDNVSRQPRRGNDRHRYRPPQSADTQQSFLNQNEFTLAISNSKIKYVDMENYLQKKELKNDSAEALKQIYSFITRAISYGLSTQLDVMPAFMDLDKDTCFERCFLRGLFSDNLHKAKTVFDRIGEVIYDFWNSESCVSETNTPEAYTIVQANEFVSGWVLLETVLKERLQICGADLDEDLDEKRINLIFLPNESYRELYVRIQRLLNQYKYNATDPTFVPVVKIIRRFIKQLNYCSYDVIKYVSCGMIRLI